MVLGAVLGAVAGGLLQGIGGRRAAKRQMQGVQRGIDENIVARDRYNNIMNPYQNAGQAALNPLMGALGIGGKTDTYQNPLLAKIQQQTLERLQNQNAATGRTSSADMAGVISQSLYEPAYQMQQARIANLQNMAGMGFNAAGAIGTNDMNTAGNLAQMYGAYGEAQANKSAAPFMAGSNVVNQFSGIAGMTGFSNPFKGLFGGGPAGHNAAGYSPSIMQNWKGS